MNRVVMAAEAFLDKYRDHPIHSATEPRTAAALAASIHSIMELQPISMVSVSSASGTTTRLIACNRPKCEILSLSGDPRIARRACLYYGVFPHVVDLPTEFEAFVELTKQFALDRKYASHGEKMIILTAHPLGRPEAANGLLVEEL